MEMEKLFVPYQFLSPSFLQRQCHAVTPVLKTVAVTPGKDEILLSLLTLLPLAHVAVLLADALPQACEILGWALFSLVEFFLPSITAASDEQLKLIIQKFARVNLAVYNATAPSQPLPLPKHCSLNWGCKLIKSCPLKVPVTKEAALHQHNLSVVISETSALGIAGAKTEI